jgi:hypothetical protein
MIARLLLVARSMSIVMATVGLLAIRKGREPLDARG